MNKSYILIILILINTLPLFGHQKDIDNPVARRYFEQNNGIANAVELTDSVFTSLSYVKETKNYLYLYYDVFNASSHCVAARIPCASDLESGEIHCMISIAGKTFYYNMNFSEFRYQLVDSTNSVQIKPGNHFIGCLRLSKKEIELSRRLYNIKMKKKYQIKVSIETYAPQLAISQFKYFSYFNFRKNSLFFTFHEI